MKPNNAGLRPGDEYRRGGHEIVLEDGVLNVKMLGQYDDERLMEFREEIYELCQTQSVNHSFVRALTMINTELSLREQAPTDNR